jgi:integrase
MMTAGVGDATINSAHRILRRLLQTAEDARVIARNPARRVEVPSVPRAKERILTPDEVAKLADAVSANYRPFVLTLAWCEVRVGEAAGLRVKNLDLVRARIHVVEALTVVGQEIIHGPTKTKKARTVTLPDFLREELACYVEARGAGPDDLVFVNKVGKPIGRRVFTSSVWQPALKRAGIAEPWPRVHDLRHTAVSFAIQVGAHPKEIQARAGHSSITTTMDRYGHLFPGQDEAPAKRLDELAHSWPYAPSSVVSLDAARQAKDQERPSDQGK